MLISASMLKKIVDLKPKAKQSKNCSVALHRKKSRIKKSSSCIILRRPVDLIRSSVGFERESDSCFAFVLEMKASSRRRWLMRPTDLKLGGGCGGGCVRPISFHPLPEVDLFLLFFPVVQREFLKD